MRNLRFVGQYIGGQSGDDAGCVFRGSVHQHDGVNKEGVNKEDVNKEDVNKVILLVLLK